MKNSIFTTTILLFCILISCNESTTNNYYYSNPGRILGKVVANYAYGNDSTFNGGIKVWLPGTKFQTFTDSLGYWRIDSIPAGIYDINFYKPGFDTTERYAFQFVGNGSIYAGVDNILQIPEASRRIDSVNFLSDSESFTPRLSFKGQCDKKCYMTFCFDTTVNVSKFSNYQINYFQFDFPPNFNFLGYAPNFPYFTGKNIYICAYPGIEGKNIDDRTGKTRIIGLGKKSNVYLLKQ